MIATRKSWQSSGALVRWAIGALTLAGFLLRAYALGAKELRGDESFAAVFAAQPFSIIWQELGHSEPHPPLYYALLHWTIAVAGPSNYALRFPSALLGALVVPALAVAAWQAFGRGPALLTALLAAVNPLLVWQAQDARMYAPLVGFTALALAGASATLAERRRDRGPLIAGSAGAAGVLLTHFYGLFIVAGMIAGLLATAMGPARAPRSRRGDQAASTGKARRDLMDAPRRRRRWSPATTLAIVLTLEVLIIALPLLWHGRAALAGHPPFSPVSALALVQNAGLTVAGGFTTPIPLRAPAGLLAILLAVLGLAVVWRRPAALLVGFTLLAPLLGLETLELLHPAYQPAYVAALAPAWLLAFGALAAAPLSWSLVGVTLTTLSLGAVAEQALTTYATSEKNLTFSQGAQLLLHDGQQGDLVLTNYPDPTLQWVYVRQDHGTLPVTLEPAAMPVSPATLNRTMISLSAQYDRIWFWTLRTPDWDPQHLTEIWLDRHALPLSTERAGNVEFRLFETPRGFQRRSVPIPENIFGGQLRVCGATWPMGSVAPGGSLAVDLCWQAVTAPQQDFTAFVHLERGASLGGQDDHPPVNGLNPTHTWLPGEMFLDHYRVRVAPNAAPGVYALRVGFYASATLQRLPLQSAEGNNGDALTIGQVTVR